MRIHILLEGGYHYISKDNEGLSSKEAIDIFKTQIDDLKFLVADLEDDSFLLIGPDTLKKAHFIFKD